MYTFNVGYLHWNMADLAVPYLNTSLALMTCIGATWVYKFELTCRNFARKNTIALILGYWVPLIASGFVHFVDSNWLIWTFFALSAWLIVYLVVLKYVMISQGYIKNDNFFYFEEFVCYGAMSIFVDIVGLHHAIDDESTVSRIVKLWWGFSSKFFIPWILWHLLLLFDIGNYFG